MFNKVQKQPPEVFGKKGVLRNFAKFTGKHLCQSLFLNKVAVLRFKIWLEIHVVVAVAEDRNIKFFFLSFVH